MLIIQVVLIIFFLFALGGVIKRYRNDSLGLGKAIAWSLLWIGAGVIVLVPDNSTVLARWVGIGRGADLIVYSSLAVVFFLLFKIMVAIDRLNQGVTELTRKIALDEKKIDNGKYF